MKSIMRCEVCNHNTLEQEQDKLKVSIGYRDRFSQVLCEECYQAISENIEDLTPEEEEPERMD